VEETFKLIEENQKNKQFKEFKNLKCKYNIENNVVNKKSGSSYMI
jgi:hypothetical protein